jgi:hypothetical protein
MKILHSESQDSGNIQKPACTKVKFSVKRENGYDAPKAALTSHLRTDVTPSENIGHAAL